MLESAEDAPCSQHLIAARLSSSRRERKSPGFEIAQIWVEVPSTADTRSVWLRRGEFTSLSLCVFIYEVEVNKNSFCVDYIEKQMR